MKSRKIRSLTRTRRKLLRKRQAIIEWLESKGADLTKYKDETELLQLAYRACGQEPAFKRLTLAGAHARYSAVMGWAGIEPIATERITTAKPLPRAMSSDHVRKFYESYAWRKVRYQVLARDGAKCALCGAGRDKGVALHVDHIRPLRKFWELRLDPENLQVLCEVCNHGKGNWDETNWRGKAA